MTTHNRTWRFTWVEMVLVIVVVGMIVAMVLPSFQQARESARLVSCVHNLKLQGLAFANFVAHRGRYPASCKVTKTLGGQIAEMHGWSWCADLLPYMELKLLPDTLELMNGKPLEPHSDGSEAHAKALATVIPEFQCPGFSGSSYVDPGTEAEAITNYNAMTSTHIESLSVASTNPGTPKYGSVLEHPDGAIYPGSKHGAEAFVDGTSHTILVVESTEQTCSRWTVGLECQVVGLPPVVTFADTPWYRFYHPTGFTGGAYDDQSTIDPTINRTYLDWDYDAKAYVGLIREGDTAVRGPGSHHVGVTNHLFADGSVHTIKNVIDCAAYMFLITRNNADPTHMPDE